VKGMDVLQVGESGKIQKVYVLIEGVSDFVL
jgi:hypothetical protein